ncbi:MAG: DNA topoisomerase I [Nanoarchaeota archaeon]
MTYTLVTTEKPSAAQKIALALADKKPTKKTIHGVAYYELFHNGEKIVVASAAGHLFTLSEKKKSSNYPVFEIHWVPSYVYSKKAKFTKRFYDSLKSLSKNASSFINACDVDIEGELIFKNILTYIYEKKNANRMYFSTLTKQDLLNSFSSMKPDIDHSLAEAGETRHMLDYFWGISSSRALTNSIKNATKHHKIMSTGRVQGPALKMIVDKEREIKAFKATPYWEIELTASHESKKIIANHADGKIFEKEKATSIFKNVQEKKALVSNLEKKEYKQLPPHPFDLTGLQIESYRVLRISPKETLEIAQSLYLTGLISYPRTSSNQLPTSLNYQSIIRSLEKQQKYKRLAELLLNGEKLFPNNGKKSDPAHPAIYPTGEIPEKLSEREIKVYDLIVKRTLATFAAPSLRQSTSLEIDVDKEKFVANGVTTLQKGWYEFYEPYVPYKEEEIPALQRGQELNIEKISMLDKETQPPKRYTPASIIKDLEKKGLGTKATRSAIIDTLYDRHYTTNESIEATNLGLKTIETLEKYCPEIIDEKLTKHFEKEMELIQKNKKNETEILNEAKEVLVKIFKTFKENELKIGAALSEANIKTADEQNYVGICEKCGGALRLMYSKKNSQYFVACSSYPNCKNTFSVPKQALIKPTRDICKECGFSTVLVIRKGKRPFTYCLNKNCKTKEEWRKSVIA